MNSLFLAVFGGEDWHDMLLVFGTSNSWYVVNSVFAACPNHIAMNFLRSAMMGYLWALPNICQFFLGMVLSLFVGFVLVVILNLVPPDYKGHQNYLSTQVLQYKHGEGCHPVILYLYIPIIYIYICILYQGTGVRIRIHMIWYIYIYIYIYMYTRMWPIHLL